MARPFFLTHTQDALKRQVLHGCASRKVSGHARLRPKRVRCNLFSPCTDSSHKLQDLQHFMSKQIDLHIFKAITAAFV